MRWVLARWWVLAGCRTALQVRLPADRPFADPPPSRRSRPRLPQLLGQQWAALPAEHKRRYADLAARVRSEGGAGGTGGLNRAVSEPGAHTTPDERPQVGRGGRVCCGLLRSSRTTCSLTP